MEERLVLDVIAPWLLPDPSLDPIRLGAERRLLPLNPLRDCLWLILDSWHDKYLSFMPCGVLVPRCLDLEKHVRHFPFPGIMTYPIHPALFYIILWHLSSGTGIHFILPSPKMCLLYKVPFINTVNCQTGLPCLFLWSFSALHLHRYSV